MSEKQTSQENLREDIVYLYVSAMDEGDLETVANILELATKDTELAKIIDEIDTAYQEEENIVVNNQEKELLKDLLYKSFPSAFTDTEKVEPLTVRHVIARLMSENSISAIDKQIVHNLINSELALPTVINSQTIKALAKTLAVNASDRFWNKFRDAAIALVMCRSNSQAQLAARQVKTYKKNKTQNNKDNK